MVSIDHRHSAHDNTSHCRWIIILLANACQTTCPGTERRGPAGETASSICTPPLLDGSSTGEAGVVRVCRNHLRLAGEEARLPRDDDTDPASEKLLPPGDSVPVSRTAKASESSPGFWTCKGICT